MMTALGASMLLVAGVAAAQLGNASGALVSFSAIGPGGLKIEGKTSELTVVEADGKVRFTVGLTNLSTGDSVMEKLRTKHMREKYLEVSKYPQAVLTVDRAALKFPADHAEVTGTVNGTMTIREQSKPVVVSYTAKRNGNAFVLTGSIPINIGQYNISVPSYLGQTVKQDMVVTLNQATVQDG
jgi:polyisoprenoid-binding protein YceI